MTTTLAALAPRQVEVDDCTLRTIDQRIDELIERSGFNRSDRQDLVQEVLADLLQRLTRFDPQRGELTSFVAMVIDHKISALINHRGAARRNWRRCVRSLDELVLDDEGGVVHLWQTLPCEAVRRHVFERK